jgi:glycosyltransferase involved in cell wall biosynthesis
MKILLATGIYPPESGGPATYVKLLETELPKRDIEISVLPFRDVRHLPKVFRHFAYFVKCLKIARKVDVVYAQDTVSVGLPAMLAATCAGTKFLVRVPGDYAWEQGRQRFGITDELDAFQQKRYGLRVGLLSMIQKKVVNSAKAVIVPSAYMKKIVDGWTDPDKVKIIYSSIELPVPVELPEKRPEGFLVVSSGRRVPWKNYEGIARAVAKEKNWHFFLAENLPRAQAMGWIQSADAFVLNSTYEGLSHTLIEAMSLGTPIVATRVGGNPELITDGADGQLIPPNDDNSLHAALKNIEAHPHEAQERAARAVERAKQFSAGVMFDSLCALLKTI